MPNNAQPQEDLDTRPLLTAPDRERLAGLDRLQRLVAAAADEIVRLRDENAALKRRVNALEQRPDIDPSDAFVAFADGPESIRQTIRHYIDTIDEYLDHTDEES